MAVATAKDVTDAFLGKESSGAGMTFSMKGAAVTFKDQKPGTKTVCGFPITGDMSNPQFMQRLQEHATELLVVCKQVTLTDAPDEQSMELVVPQMKPLPQPEGQLSQ